MTIHWKWNRVEQSNFVCKTKYACTEIYLFLVKKPKVGHRESEKKWEMGILKMAWTVFFKHAM